MPDEAERQDWQKVRAILDYRNAKAAVEMFNDAKNGAGQLAKHPELMQLLLEMHRAQLGDGVTMEQVQAMIAGE